MANATNGSADSGAPSAGRSAERSRAEAALLAGLRPARVGAHRAADPDEARAAEVPARSRTIAATATGRAVVTVAAEPSAAGSSTDDPKPSRTRTSATGTSQASTSATGTPQARSSATGAAQARSSAAGAAGAAGAAKGKAPAEPPAAPRSATPARSRAATAKPTSGAPSAKPTSGAPTAKSASGAPAVKSTSSRKPADETTTAKTAGRTARKSTSAAQPEPPAPPAKSVRRPAAEQPPAKATRRASAEEPAARTTRRASAEEPAARTTRRAPAEEPPAKTTRRPAAKDEPATRGKAQPDAESARNAATRAALATRGVGPAKAVPDNRATPARVQSVEAALEARKGTATKSPAPSKRAPKRTAGPEPLKTRPHDAPRDEELATPPPAEMTRGILELAAERLAASRATQAPPAADPEPADEKTPFHVSGSVVARSSARALPPAGTRRQHPAEPLPEADWQSPAPAPEAAWPTTTPEAAWPAAAPETDWPAAVPEADWQSPDADRQPQAAATETRWADPDLDLIQDDRPGSGAARGPIGLPASLRLPASLPDNLWRPPPAEIEPHTGTATRPEADPATEVEPQALTETHTLTEPQALAEPHTLAEPHGPTEPQSPDSQIEPHAGATAPTAEDVPPTRLDAWGAPGQTRADAEHGEPRIFLEAPEETTAERVYPPLSALGQRLQGQERGFLPGGLTHGDDRRGDDPLGHGRPGDDPYGRSGEDDDHHPSGRSPLVRQRIRRRRRAVLLAYLMVVAGVLVAGHQLREQERPTTADSEAAQRADEPAAGGGAQAPAATQGVVPETGAPTGGAAVEPDREGRTGSAGEDQRGSAASADQQGSVLSADGSGGTEDSAEVQVASAGEAGEFRYAKNRGPMLGGGGKLHRFRVAVEKTVGGTSAAEFAEVIDETLGDERSWIDDDRMRMRRVTDAAKADFTIYLASASTSERMCATGGLSTEGFTSCRVPGQVIINADRWADGVPDYQGHLDEYRMYAINHEVGHELGHGHEACPGDGEKAPVMMQQTYGLDGCTRNAWPYLDGKRYAGEPTP
jgi:hypothetical protein